MIELIVGGIVHHIRPVHNIETTSFKRNAIIKIDRLNVMIGKNSINKPLAGLAYDYKISENVNFKVGGYVQDETDFNHRGVSIATGDFMPIVGFEINIPLSDRIGIDTFVSPLITFTGIKFKF